MGLRDLFRPKCAFPEPLRSQLLAGQPVVFAEHLPGVLSWRAETAEPSELSDFRPKRRTAIAIAVTKERLVVLERSETPIDIPLAEFAQSGFAPSLPERDVLRLEVTMPSADGDPPGTLFFAIDIRTPDAARIASLLPP